MTALTPIAEYCQLRDITMDPGSGDDNIVASDTALLAFNLPCEADVVSMAMVEIANDSPLAVAGTTCAGGAAPSTATKKYICEMSLSGTSAGPFDYRFVVEKIDRGLTVVLSGRSLDGGYADNAVARLTLNRTTLLDALTGAAGTIVPQADPTDVGITYAYAATALPNEKGLYLTEPNPVDGVNDLSGHSYFRMPVSVDNLGALLIDGDSKDNFINVTAQDFLNVTVGVPITGAPLGSYSHIVADTSDASLNLTGVKQGLAVGFLGSGDYLTFKRDPSPVDITSALIIEPEEGLILSTDLSTTMAKIKPSGGYSNHGLPAGFTIADGLCIPSTDATTTNWYDSLFIFVGSDASGLGGLYFWAHNGLAYRIGQELDFASCVAYDSVTNKIYVGCRGGVFSIICTPATGFAAKLDREGTLNTQNGMPAAGGVVAIRVVVAGSGTTIVAQVQGSGTADGLYYRDDSAPSGYAYDGYYAFDTGGGSILGFHYDGAGDALWVVYGDNANEVSTTTNARTTTPSTVTTAIPSGAHCVGIDPLGGYGAAIRTEAGADGLYLISTSIISLNPHSTLVDRYNASVQVNRIQFASNGLYIGSGGSPAVPAQIVASTDAGPYVCADVTDAYWVAMPKQSGIGGQNVAGTAIGYPQTLGGDSTQPGRLTTRMYCWPTLWISHSAGIWFDEEYQEKTELGAFLSALGAVSDGGQGQFLDNDVAAIGFHGASGKPDAPATTGTSGRAVYVNTTAITTNGLQDMPDTAMYLRPLDNRNRFVPLFMDTVSASPTGRIGNANFPSIQSDNATPAATASGKLAQATVRKYHDSATVPHTVEFDSSLAFQEMKLRSLRPTHRVATDYDTSSFYTVDLSTTKFYMLKTRLYKSRPDDVTQFQGTACTVMRSMPPSDQQISDGFGATMSKIIRQGHQ